MKWAVMIKKDNLRKNLDEAIAKLQEDFSNIDDMENKEFFNGGELFVLKLEPYGKE